MLARAIAALSLVAGAAVAGAVAAEATAAESTAAAKGWRDVLDTPAVQSAFASRSLLFGLARAGERVVAVGQRGHVLWSDDGGKAWQQAEVPVSSDLVAVHFPNATHGWTVGHDGVVLHTSDAGKTWKRQLDGRRAGELMVEYYSREAGASLASDPKRAAALVDEAKRFAAQGAENPFLDVWFADASNGFVVGAFGQIFRTTDGGASWQPWLHAVDNPKGLHLNAVRGIGADVYVVGEQGLALKLDRAAGRFRTLELPYNGTLFGVTGSERAVVVHGLRGSVLRSADGGQSWQTVNTGLQVGLTASTRHDDGRFIIVSQAGHVLASVDDGATFVPVRMERPVPAAAVAASTQGTLIIAGPRGAQPQPLP
jgi:photosystem II stability/assembly factor-like uncharacterized protein